MSRETYRANLRVGTTRPDTLNKNALLAHIHDRLHPVADEDEGGLPDWLLQGDCVDLKGLGVSMEDTEPFDFRSWLKTPNPTFGNRTPSDIINSGLPEERRLLALAIDAIAALKDSAFS